MTNKPVVRSVQIDGEPADAISLADFARLLGQDPAAVRAEYDMQQAINPGAPFRLPPAWLQAGRRIAKETAAKVGTYDAADHLAHHFPDRPLHQDREQ